jgi:oligoendopeptidase F
MEKSYLKTDFKITDWSQLQRLFEELLQREIPNEISLMQWMKDRSELESVLWEDMAWRYIRMTCDTENALLEKHYQDYIQHIEPQVTPYSNRLNKKLLDHPLIEIIERRTGYGILLREIRKDISLFRDDNVALQVQGQTLSSRYGKLSGAMTITLDGKTLTMPQASVCLKSTDRDLRKKAFLQMSARRLQDRETLEEILDKLIQLRHQIASNAGFDNYRDYAFIEKGRFDYTPEDCFRFHESIRHEVLPLFNQQRQRQKQLLKLETLCPWDVTVDAQHRPALKPFESSEALLQKTIRCLNRIDPYFADCLSSMKERGYLDLESRPGKADGGYNYPLPESDIPFIFMNAASSQNDVRTLTHEAGHAIHAFLNAPLELVNFKNTPSEIAELASMSMELISMDAWDEFYPNEDELKRAKLEQLEGIISRLCNIAAIDRFQHWLYQNPNHTHEERRAEWHDITENFYDTVTDWSAITQAKDYNWQRVLHIFELPFYYIEYGMAQLGALAIWKNYRENPAAALSAYKAALALGYTRTIPKTYQAANIQFDFSQDYIRELMQFLQTEIESLY